MQNWFKSSVMMMPTRFKIRREKLSSLPSAQDNVSAKMMHALIHRWCVINSFLILSKDSKRYVPNITNNDLSSKLQRYVYMINFKQLHTKSYLIHVLNMLKDTKYDMVTSRLIDLYLQILIDIDPDYLNRSVNKLIYGIQSIYPETNDSDHVSWQEILTSWPYLWLLFYIQSIMRDANVEHLSDRPV